MQGLFHKQLVFRFERELLLIHRVIVLQVESVFVLVAPSQVRFGHTDDFPVLLEQGQIPGFVLVGNIEIGIVGNFLVGHEPLRFGLQFMDELVNHLLIQWNRFVHFGPLIQCSDEFVLPKGDRVGNGVGDGHQADLVLVEFDDGGTSNEVPVAW